jgi:lysyl-tRNA synthetase class 2
MVQEQEQERRSKMSAVRAAGADPFDAGGVVPTPIDYVRSEFRADMVQEGPEQIVAGRVKLRRTMGQLHFLTIEDNTGVIQVALRRSTLNDHCWLIANNLDLGDIIMVRGNLGQTKTNEVTVWAKLVTIVSKALTPPPQHDKAGGFKDEEDRRRYRHVDLMVNKDVRDKMLLRSRFIHMLRDVMHTIQYTEVETPVLQTQAGGATAKPFVTHHNELKHDFSLRIATELYLKRLLVGGLWRVYEIGKVFRNEGMSPKHNPEFTSLEAYCAFGDYRTMMDLVADLIGSAARLCGVPKVQHPSGEILLTEGWREVTFSSLVAEYVNNNSMAGPYNALEIYENKIEPTLIQPTFVTHMPSSLYPLAKESKEHPGFADMFELVIAGQEMGCGYSEVNDPDEQTKHFEAQAKDGQILDQDFIDALKYGMPPAGGIGLGLDRLVALVTGSPNIRDVILFPTLKPVNG